MKNLTKKVVACLACTAAFSAFGVTGALADEQSTTMSYNNKLITCKLTVDWNLFGNDYGKAETYWSFDNGINKVYAYLIGDTANGTDVGNVFAEVNVAEEGVWDFNSTHKLLHGDGVTSLVSKTLADW